MKWVQKRNRYEGSNVHLSITPLEAFSWNWWQFVKVINGKTVFNDHWYSQSTNNHQKKVRWMLEHQLGMNIDYVIRCPVGLQNSDWFKSSECLIQSEIDSLKVIMNSNRRVKHLDNYRHERLNDLINEMKTLYDISGTLHNIMESE